MNTPDTKPKSLFDTCKLEGVELDEKVARVLDCAPGAAYSSDWSHGGPLIESNHIFLDAPHEKHVYYGEGRGGQWVEEELWTATVSAAVRTKPNPNDPQLPRFVGRGCGPTALIACMRAIVDSFGES